MVKKRSSHSQLPPVSQKHGYISFILVMFRGFLLLWISFSINILNLMIYLTVRPWSRGLARRLIGDYIQVIWFEATCWLLPVTKLIITGDGPGDVDQPAIMIANHQIDADWWFSWELARAYKLHGRLKIILKADLRNIPVMGWGMRQFEFLFLDRKWESDRQRLYSHLGSFVDDGFQPVLLLYPEGTTINSRTLDKCRTFAQDKQRPLLKHLLLPRTTGFAACLDALSSSGKTPIIYDVTIAYSGYSGEVPSWDMGYSRSVDTDVPSVADLFRGRTARAVHLHVRRLSGDKHVLADCERFLDERWREKDALLQHFIKHQSFLPVPPSPTASLSSLDASPTAIGDASPESSDPAALSSPPSASSSSSSDNNSNNNSKKHLLLQGQGPTSIGTPAAAASPVSSLPRPRPSMVLSPRGRLSLVLFLLCLPSLFFLCLPLLSLFFLLFSPALILAGTMQLLSAVLSPPSPRRHPGSIQVGDGTEVAGPFVASPPYEKSPVYARFQKGVKPLSPN